MGSMMTPQGLVIGLIPEEEPKKEVPEEEKTETKRTKKKEDK